MGIDTHSRVPVEGNLVSKLREWNWPMAQFAKGTVWHGIHHPRCAPHKPVGCCETTSLLCNVIQFPQYLTSLANSDIVGTITQALCWLGQLPQNCKTQVYYTSSCEKEHWFWCLVLRYAITGPYRTLSKLLMFIVNTYYLGVSVQSFHSCEHINVSRYCVVSI